MNSLALTVQKLWLLLYEIQDAGRRPSWISIFLNCDHYTSFPLFISRHLPNLKSLALTVHKLQLLIRKSKSRPVAILDFDFCEFW